MGQDGLFLLTATGTEFDPDALIVAIDGTAIGPVFAGIPIGVAGQKFLSSAALTYTSVFATESSVTSSGSPGTEALYATDPAIGLPVLLDVPGLSVIGNGSADGLVSVGAVAVFAGTSATDTGLWRTDGTDSGTYELRPAGAALDFRPSQISRVGNLAYFTGTAADGTLAFWQTDGSNAGTVEVPLGVTGLTSALAIGTVNGELIVAVTQNSAGTADLLATNGTPGGTRIIAAGFSAQTFTDAGYALPNGSLLLTDGSHLYVTDGRSAPVLLSDFGIGPTSPSNPVGVNDVSGFSMAGGQVVFEIAGFGALGGHFSELWRTDGTAAGTQEISTNAGGNAFSSEPQFAALTSLGDGRVLFQAYDPGAGSTSTGLWVTDGTDSGTREIAAGIDPIKIVADGSRAFVSGAAGLYVTDGTAEGTRLIDPVVAGLAFTAGVLDAARVTVSGTHDQYGVAVAPDGGLAIADTVAGRDGTADYAGAHVIAFSDGTGLLDPTGNAAAVARLYQSALDRPADLGGLINFTEQLDSGAVSLLQVANAAAASPEFTGDHGVTSDSDFISILYENTVHRAPDPSGLAGYVADLRGGESRGAVLLDISQSFEARFDGRGVAGQANDATVYRLYEAVVDRAPDYAGQQVYSSALAGGATVQQLAAAMLNSPEYAATFGTPSDAQFATDLYANLLHRAPDPGGFAAMTGALAAGVSRADVIAGAVGSTEARLVTAQATHDGWVFL